MAHLLATQEQVTKLCEIFGVEMDKCTRLTIDIQPGKAIRAYANSIARETDEIAIIAEVLGTAEWKAEEVVS